MSVQIVRSLEIQQWRDFVASHPQANVFHTPEMFEVFSRAKGHTPALWAAVAGGRLLVLFLPVQIESVDGWVGRLAARSVVFGGVLCSACGEAGKALAALLEVYSREAKKATLFTEIRNLSDMEAILPVLTEHGYTYEDHLNFQVDLRRRPEEVFQSIGPRTRKNIRRALKKGEVTISEINDRAGLAIGYDMLERTYRLARVPLADRSLFEAAFEVLKPAGMLRCLLADVPQGPVAVSFELLYKTAIYGWYGGIDRRFSAFSPNELLTWHMLEWGARSGFHLYDFGGAGRSDKKYGVRDFKAKFGGQLVSFGRNICVHRPILTRVSRIGYYFYQRSRRSRKEP
jgi:serine/alanine adding enzyme